MSREPRIDAYIAKAQPFARPILEKVRERAHATVPDIEEAIKWSMPAYTLGGKIVLITAAFKAHTALNFWRGQELNSSHDSVGAMGQFGRIKSIDELPSDTELDRLIREAAELAKSAPAPRKPKHAPKPPAEMHPALSAALEEAPRAKAAFYNFAPSHRREYLDWVAEAKRDETRQKRIETTIEWLSEGKKRNWQYERC
ncbi:MAG TPA: YdeI/OmpD-associated family protein [Sphingomicrobium sp.]|nr:YdeI/OmpD-associated family protein [Sphingomicrobium sp.]